MTITENLTSLAAKHGVDIRRAVQVAGIHRATWARWKSGRGARFNTVELVRNAIQSLATR